MIRTWLSQLGRLPNLLGVICLCLGGVISTEVAHSVLHGPIDAQEGNIDRAIESSSPAKTLPQDQVSEIVARPLFNPSRQPDPEALTNPETAAKDGDFRLVGFIITPERRTALFAVAGTPKPVGLAVGGALGRWQIASIDPTQVVLVSALEQKILQPTADPNHKAAAMTPGTLSAGDTPPSTSIADGVPSKDTGPPARVVRHLAGPASPLSRDPRNRH